MDNMETRTEIDMEDELNRIKTFTNWPKRNTVSALLIAICGFFFRPTGKRDEVECFKCKMRLKHWSKEDNPYQRHKQSSPNCSFLEQHNDLPEVIAGHQWIENRLREQQGSALSNADEAYLQNEWTRIQTFFTWPQNSTVSALRLASCGFIYSGMDDEVVCCGCNTRLKHWRANDNPQERHKESAPPHCPFLQRDAKLEGDLTNEVVVHQRPELPFRSFRVEPGKVHANASVDDPIIQMARAFLDMGFSEDEIEMANKYRLQTGGNEEIVGSLLDALHKLKVAEAQTQTSATSVPRQNSDDQNPDARSSAVAAVNSNESSANIGADYNVTRNGLPVRRDTTPHHLILVGPCKLVPYNLLEESCTRTGIQLTHDSFVTCQRCRHFVTRLVLLPCKHLTCRSCLRDIRDHYHNICPFCEGVVEGAVMFRRAFE